MTRAINSLEEIILETRSRPWVALSIGSCGILAEAMVWHDGPGGGHDENYMGTRSFALEFAHRVVCAIGLSSAHERVPTPQILVEVATALNDGPEHVALLCTTWQYVLEGVEICSVGTNSVLVFEGDAIEEVITRHTVSEIQRRQGSPVSDLPRAQGVSTHALGGRDSCSVDDVSVALIPLRPSTTIAVIEDWRLTKDIMGQAVSRNELPSFIEAWDPPGKRVRTSVLISL